MTIIKPEAMKKEELRKILKGKCVSDESCEAAISELLDLFNVRLSSLSDEDIKKEALARAKINGGKSSKLEVNRLEGMGFWTRYMVEGR